VHAPPVPAEARLYGDDVHQGDDDVHVVGLVAEAAQLDALLGRAQAGEPVVAVALGIGVLQERLRADGAEWVLVGVLVVGALSITDPDSYYSVNVAGTKGVLDAMRRAGVDKIVFSSTAATTAATSSTTTPTCSART